MWKKIKGEKPKYSGTYYVFGTVNKDTVHETKSRFVADYDTCIDKFTDAQGEDFTFINESVEYWFDFSLVKNPE